MLNASDILDKMIISLFDIHEWVIIFGLVFLGFLIIGLCSYFEKPTHQG